MYRARLQLHKLHSGCTSKSERERKQGRPREHQQETRILYLKNENSLYKKREN